MGDCLMATLKINGDTSGYVELVSPAVAGSTSIALDKILVADGSGNVGIGTSSPVSALHIDAADSAADGFRMKNTAGESVEFYYASSAADADFIINRTGSGAADIGLKHTGDAYFTSGNVGIGTSSPDTKLHVFKATAGSITDYANNGLIVENSGDVGISMHTPNANAGHLMFGSPADEYHSYIRGGYGASTTSTLKFYTDNINTMTHKAGNVGIGTDSPDAVLDVTRSGDGTIAIFQNTGSHGFEFSAPSSTALQIASRQGSKNLDLWANTLSFSAGGSESMRIDSSGNIGIGTTSPDAIFTVETNVAAVSTGTIARFHSSKGESDSTFLQIAATRHPTASVQRVQLQAFDDDGSTGRTLALNSSGGNVGIGTNSPNATLTVSQSANNIFAVERTGVASGSGQFGINVENNSQATVSYDDGAQLVFGTASSPSIHTGFTERMRIDSSGIVTKPYQPIGSFSHSASVNYSQDDLTSANFYSHTWVNQGNHFNASTGRFTCPVAGIYRIYFRATGSGNSNIRLRKNGSTVNEAYENAGTNHSVSSEAVVPCAANDYLHIQIASGNFLSGTQHKQVTFELMS